MHGGINREKVKDGWRDEQREGVEEQTDAGRRWRQESNLVKTEWDVLFLNVERRRERVGGGARERDTLWARKRMKTREKKG